MFQWGLTIADSVSVSDHIGGEAALRPGQYSRGWICLDPTGLGCPLAQEVRAERAGAVSFREAGDLEEFRTRGQTDRDQRGGGAEDWMKGEEISHRTYPHSRADN